MIDFVSTRPGVDPEVQKCAQFMAHMIANVVRWAALAPTADERRQQVNLRPEALYAIEYLFDEDSEFSTHISLLGSDADTFRAALLSDRPIQASGGFNDGTRHIIKVRHNWWAAAHKLNDLVNAS